MIQMNIEIHFWTCCHLTNRNRLEAFRYCLRSIEGQTLKIDKVFISFYICKDSELTEEDLFQVIKESLITTKYQLLQSLEKKSQFEHLYNISDNEDFSKEFLIMFGDDDDMSIKDRAQKQKEHLLSSGKGVSYCNFYYPKKFNIKEFDKNMNIYVQTMVF